MRSPLCGELMFKSSLFGELNDGDSDEFSILPFPKEYDTLTKEPTVTRR